MPIKRGRQEKGEADLGGPPTTPPHQVRIRATSPPATPAPKRVKQVKQYLKDWGFWGPLPSEEGNFILVERELTAFELHLEWSAVMETEYERLREAHKQVYALQQELQEVEQKWAAELEDAVDEIGLLKTRLKERDRDDVAANEKYATLSKECKGRGKEIAALREAVANLKEGKRDKEVEKAVQMEVKGCVGSLYTN